MAASDDFIDAMTYAVNAFSSAINPMTMTPAPERDRGMLRDPSAFSQRRNFCRELLDQWRTYHGRYSSDQMAQDIFIQAFEAYKESREMTLFEYAAFYTGTGKDDKSVVLVEPKTILAKTEANARTLAARAIPEEYTDRLDKVTIVVRPFV
jgi:hypothetical protein